MSQKENSYTVIPNHIGIIMDGNGRWAKGQGLPRTAGHKKGAKVFGEIAKYCKEVGVKHLTVYAFSTENWKRPQEEIDAIMDLLKHYLKEVMSSTEQGVKLLFLGDREPLPKELKELIRKAEEKTSHFNEMTVNIALNYGGRAEITNAVKEISTLILNGELNVKNIDENLISNYLYTKNQPDPDIIIRPGQEKRTSNFLLWQGAYSELVFMDVLWPNFTSKHIDEAIEVFSKRNRKFGGVVGEN